MLLHPVKPTTCLLRTRMSIELYSIGVYGKSEQDFFHSLAANNIDLFCDVRMRRGVRGSQYAFVNSTRLQERLSELGIRYIHVKELAPTQEIRDKQKAADKLLGVEKREREELGSAFVKAYEDEKLAHFDSLSFLESLGSDAQRVVFFCVESAPSACHRSLITTHLASDLHLKVTHL